MNQVKINKKNNWVTYALILLGIFIFVLVYSSSNTASGNVAIINIDGLIQFSSEDVFSTSSYFILNSIYDLADDPSIDALILRVNSPGGTPVASNKIASAIEYFSNQNKTVVSVVDEVGASGAYLISSASDRIFLDRMSLVGSIGVKSSRFSFEGLLKDYNISYYTTSSGDYKDFGDVFIEPSKDELDALEKISNDLHEEFIQIVMDNRNISRDYADRNNLFSGLIFLGDDAIEHGLVDEIGGMREAKSYLQNTENITVTSYNIKKSKGLFENIYGLSHELLGDEYLRMNLLSPFLFVYDN
ncbi:MAG: S49 family peptidase [Candidatus Woesearchaeota archaeon]